MISNIDKLKGVFSYVDKYSCILVWISTPDTCMDKCSCIPVWISTPICMDKYFCIPVYICTPVYLYG